VEFFCSLQESGPYLTIQWNSFFTQSNKIKLYWEDEVCAFISVRAFFLRGKYSPDLQLIWHWEVHSESYRENLFHVWTGQL